MGVKTPFEAYSSCTSLIAGIIDIYFCEIGKGSDCSKKLTEILSQKYNKMILVSYNIENSDEAVMNVMKFLIPHLKTHFS